MTNEIKKHVSTSKLLWEKIKAVLEYAHLGDYLLHPAHSDILALLILSLKTPAGWAALGWIFALYLLLRPILSAPRASSNKRGHNPRQHRKCLPPKPKARKRTSKSLKPRKKRTDR